MIFKRGKKTCVRCGEKYPEVYDFCPICHPGLKEEDFGNLTILIGIGIVFIFVVLYYYVFQSRATFAFADDGLILRHLAKKKKERFGLEERNGNDKIPLQEPNFSLY